jgi:cyclopropane fatty-acyl-phospholipid synthase-like methyltransferase
MRQAHPAAFWPETFTFLRSAIGRPTVAPLYNFVGTDNYYTRTSLYVNLGYWAKARTLDEASEALACLLARKAGLQPGDDVLDCGFGFGDQDLFWLRHFSPKRIAGINVTQLQVAIACERVKHAGLAGRIHLGFGSATALPFASGSFDKVLALESAFHFETRARFFSEAMRVLRPGGTLATTDLILGNSSRFNIRSRLIHGLHCGLWQIPVANMYPQGRYAAELAKAGYTNIHVDSIASDVFGPYLAYCEWFARRAPERKRLNWMLRIGPSAMRQLNWFDQYDYVVARGDKPAGGNARS